MVQCEDHHRLKSGDILVLGKSDDFYLFLGKSQEWLHHLRFFNLRTGVTWKFYVNSPLLANSKKIA